MINIMGSLYMTDKEASKRYGFSISWFQKQRSNQKPPPYIKIKGKVLYPLQDTDSWFRQNTQRYFEGQNLFLK